MNAAILRRLRLAERASQPAVLATRLSDGEQHVLPDPGAPPALARAANEALARGDSRLVDLDAETWFLRVHAPPPRLMIVGAVHIAQALAALAATCGYAVTIIDPRRSFASADRFPGLTLVHAWPDEALAGLRPDVATSIVTLTHDPKLDDPALMAALGTPACFIGALGSRKTHAARLARLADQGMPQEALGRVRGPVGLALNAVSAAEIALSILAEIIAVRRGAALGER